MRSCVRLVQTDCTKIQRHIRDEGFTAFFMTIEPYDQETTCVPSNGASRAANLSTEGWITSITRSGRSWRTARMTVRLSRIGCGRSPEAHCSSSSRRMQLYPRRIASALWMQPEVCRVQRLLLGAASAELAWLLQTRSQSGDRSPAHPSAWPPLRPRPPQPAP